MKWLISLLLLVTLLVFPGCTNQAELQDAWDSGYQEGFSDGEDVSFDVGFNEGYREAEARNYENAYQDGYDDGYQNAFDLNYEDAYQNGFWAGEDEGSGAYEGVAEDSYYQGYSEGYEDCLNGFSDYYDLLQEGVPASVYDASDFFIEVISLTSPVSPGEYATIELKTLPDEMLAIGVWYQSGKSEAMGLSPKRANDDGNISWTWKVGTNTTPGQWKIVISSLNMFWWFRGYDNITKTVYFEVTP